MELTREERISDAFFVLGTKYFATARFSAISSPLVMPICGNLYHHAIEMFIKGYLAKFMATSKLKKIGHNLVELWETAKKISKDKNLVVFDLVIFNLDKFEEIRYPDSIVDKGMMVGVSDGKGPSLVDQFQGEKPKYKMNIQQLDNLVKKIFELVSISPSNYFDGLPDDFRKFIPVYFFSENE